MGLRKLFHWLNLKTCNHGKGGDDVLSEIITVVLIP